MGVTLHSPESRGETKQRVTRYYHKKCSFFFSQLFSDLFFNLSHELHESFLQENDRSCRSPHKHTHPESRTCALTPYPCFTVCFFYVSLFFQKLRQPVMSWTEQKWVVFFLFTSRERKREIRGWARERNN